MRPAQGSETEPEPVSGIGRFSFSVTDCLCRLFRDCKLASSNFRAACFPEPSCPHVAGTLLEVSLWLDCSDRVPSPVPVGAVCRERWALARPGPASRTHAILQGFPHFIAGLTVLAIAWFLFWMRA